MCGRYALTATPEAVSALLGYRDRVDFPPRYNIAPTQPIAVVRLDRGEPRFALMRWGLIPGWTKDPDRFGLLFNARAETAAEKPAFTHALRYRRCLVPASGFYEWRRAGGRRQPYWMQAAGSGPVAFAGLWEGWAGADGSEIDTVAILTTTASPDLAFLGGRMPLVIAPEHFDPWLAMRSLTAREGAVLLAPPAPGRFEPVAIGEAVNAAGSDGPGLQRPAPGHQMSLF